MVEFNQRILHTQVPTARCVPSGTMDKPTSDLRISGELEHENEALMYEPAPEEPLPTALVTAVREVANTEVEELKPLHSVINPDALDNLFASAMDGTPRTDEGVIAFTYESYRIRIAHDDTITLLERDED